MNRFIALFLAFIMTLNMLPLQAFAEDSVVIKDPDIIEQIINGDENSVSEELRPAMQPEFIMHEISERPSIGVSETTDGKEIFETLAANVIQSGQCGDNATWELTDDGTLTISGTGTMTNFSYQASPWYEHRDTITSVIIDKEITSIGSYSFQNFTLLEGITISEKITKIGSGSFQGCSSLKSISIPEGVSKITSSVFSGCSMLESVDLPESITLIDMQAFYNCTSLKSITIPKNVTSIAREAFKGCSELEKIDIPEGVISIGSAAFYECSSLKNIILPDGIAKIEANTFRGCLSLESVVIPDSVTSIDYNAFADCASLTGVKVSKNLTSLSSAAFANCGSLVEIYIPENITSIGTNVFLGCTSLKYILYPGTEEQWAAIAIDSTNTVLNSVEKLYNFCENEHSWIAADCNTPKHCALCNYQSGEPEHKWVEADCYLPKHCELCNISIGEVKHGEAVDSYVAPTCTQTGLTEGSHCPTCGEILVEQQIVEALGHNIGFKSNGDGSKTGTCQRCNETITEESIIAQGTAGKEGVIWLLYDYDVNGVGETLIFRGTGAIPAYYGAYALPWTEYISGIEKAFFEKGITVIGKCTLCEHNKLTEIRISDTVNEIGPSVTYNSYNLKTIYYEGSEAEWNSITINTNYNNPLVNASKIFNTCVYHNWIDASCTKGKYCTGCGKETSAALGHKAAAAVEENRTEANCLNDGGYDVVVYCSVCNEELSRDHNTIAALGHSFTNYLNENDATCETDGHETAKCDRCDVTDTRIIADSALGHNYNAVVTLPDCTENGYTTHTCLTCGDIVVDTYVDALGHNNSSVITLPDCTNGGYTTYTCTVCGASFVDEYVSALGHDIDFVSNGDGTKSGECKRCHQSITEKEILASGSCGTDAQWQLWDSDSNGVGETLIISGSGEMYNFESVEEIPWYAHKGTITSVLIQSGITSIGKYAFFECSYLTNIEIPAGVTSVGYMAFRYCSSLKEIVLPEGLISIGANAFDYCSSLNNISLPDSVTEIDSSAFSCCTSLVEVLLPKDLKVLERDMFYGCSSLSDIELPSGLQKIGEYAFYQCYALNSVTIPDTVAVLGYNAFDSCTSLKNITLHKYLIDIGTGVFKNCTALEEIVIEEGIATISNSDFYGCTSLRTVYLPESLREIGYSAFYGCTNLAKVYFGGSQTLWNNVINISSGNTCLNNAEFQFAKLQSIIDSGKCGLNITWTLHDDYTLVIDGTGPMNNFETDSAPWIDYRNKITTVIVEEGVTSIGDHSFGVQYSGSCYSSIKSISLPETLEYIGDYAFSYCIKLESVVIPDGVKTIGNYAFYNCDNMVSIQVPGSIITMGSKAFSDCDKLSSVIFGDDIEIIGSYAFSNCGALQSVVIPGTVKKIENFAFDDCGTLSSVTLHYGLDTIGYGAFMGTDIEKIIIPESVKTIKGRAFRDCKKLVEVELPEIVKTFEGQIFYGCSSLKTITIPNGVKELPGYDFYNCASLESVRIPVDITFIDEYTFYGCTALTDVYYNASDAQWKLVTVEAYNEPLTNAQIHCSRTGVSVIGSCGPTAEWQLWDSDSDGTGDTIIVYGTGEITGTSWAEHARHVTSVIVENGITAIPEVAFKDFIRLKKIELAGTVKTIGTDAFSGCTALTTLYFDGTDQAWGDVNILSGNETLTGALLINGIVKDSGTVGDNIIWEITTQGQLVLRGNGLMADCTEDNAPWNEYTGDVESVYIENGIEAIGRYAFSNCNKLKCIEIPETVVSVNEHAFDGCENLTQIIYDGSRLEWAEINNSLADLSNVNIIFGKYDIIVEECENGTITIDKTVVKAGETVTVTYEPARFCLLDDIYVDGTAIEGKIFIASGEHKISASFLQVECRYLLHEVPNISLTEDFTANMTVVLQAGDTLLEKDKDFKVEYQDSAKDDYLAEAVITGLNEYSNLEKTITFPVKKIDISECKINIASSVTYYGYSIEPAVSVYYNNKYLTENSDYIVTYSENANRGIGYARVIGIGNFTGSITKNYYISLKNYTSSINFDVTDNYDTYRVQNNSNLNIYCNTLAGQFYSHIEYGIYTGSSWQNIYKTGSATASFSVSLPRNTYKFSVTVIRHVRDENNVPVNKTMTKYFYVDSDDYAVSSYPTSKIAVYQKAIDDLQNHYLYVKPTEYNKVVSDVIWTSSDEEIAVVSDGIVTFNKPGIVTINADSDGKTNSITISESKRDIAREAQIMPRDNTGTDFVVIRDGVELKEKTHYTLKYNETEGFINVTATGIGLYEGSISKKIHKDSGYTISCLHKETELAGNRSFCFDAGYSGDVVCTYCREIVEVGEDIPATGHLYTIIEVTPPGCESQGYSTHICSQCGDSYVDSYVNATGHIGGTPVNEPGIEAGCYNKGNYYEVTYCTGCGIELERVNVVVEPLGHTFTDYISDGDATCTQDGHETAKCERCSVKDRRVAEGSALGHDYIETVTPPKCTEQGFSTFVCSRCRQRYIDSYVDATGHTGTEAVKENIVEAKCLEEGSYDSVIYCSVCRKELSREAMTIEKLGHTFTEYVLLGNGKKTSGCDRCDARETVNDVVYGGEINENICWFIDSTNTLYIIGSGVISHITEENIPWAEHKDIIEKAVIAAGITNIPDFAFKDCANLEKVDIPETVKDIGKSAFENCISIEEITIPAGTDSIGENAFTGCDSLDKVIYNGTSEQWNEIDTDDSFGGLADKTVKTTADYYYVEKEDGTIILSGADIPLEGIIIIPADQDGKTVTVIGENAFSDNEKITGLKIPDTVKEIDTGAFSGCSGIEWIEIPPSVECIAEKAFEGVDRNAKIYIFGNPYAVQILKVMGFENVIVMDYINATITIDKDYLVAQIGECYDITAKTTYPADVIWSVEGDSVEITPSGNSCSFTAVAPGTSYVVASAVFGEQTVYARCRVDVTESVPAATISAAHLAEKTATSNIYSTEYAQLNVHFDLEQNMSVMDTESTVPADTGLAVEDAYFTNEAVKSVFDLRVKDDRTLEIIPVVDVKDSAAVKAVKGSYKTQVTVVVNGTEYTTVETVTLKTAKKLPAVKANAVKLNSFYTEHTLPLVFSNPDVTAVSVDESKRTAKVPAIPAWLELNEDMTVSLKEDFAGKGSGKLYLEAEVEGWTVPVKVTVSVSAANTAPKLKLSQTKAVFNTYRDKAVATEISLLSANKKVAFDTINVTNVRVADPAELTVKEQTTYKAGENYAVTAYDIRTGAIVLDVAEGKEAVSGKVMLLASIAGSQQKIKLPVTVTAYTKAPSFKLAKTSVTLNTHYAETSDTVSLKVTATPADYLINTDNFSWTITDTKGNELSQTALDVAFADNTVTVKANETTAAGKYKVVFALEDAAKTVTLNVTVKAPVLKLSKTAVTLNKLLADSTEITLKATPADYQFTEDNINWTITDGKNNELPADTLTVEREEGTVKVSVNENTEYGKTYKVKFKLTETGKETVLTVKTLAETGVAKVALTVKGKLQTGYTDKGVTVAAKWTNLAGGADIRDNLKVYAKATAKGSVAVDVTDRFDIVSNGDGTYTVKYKDLGAVHRLNHKDKYTVVAEGITVNGQSVADSKAAAIGVTFTKPKVNQDVKSVKLYLNDKYSRGEVRLTLKDSTLPAIARVEIAESKISGYYDLENLGNGVYAIGFKDDEISPLIKAGTLKLNIYLEGNNPDNKTPNATVSVKVENVKFKQQ